MLAAKASLAARVDALGEDSNVELGMETRAKVESRVRALEEGQVNEYLVCMSEFKRIELLNYSTLILHVFCKYQCWKFMINNVPSTPVSFHGSKLLFFPFETSSFNMNLILVVIIHRCLFSFHNQHGNVSFVFFVRLSLLPCYVLHVYMFIKLFCAFFCRWRN